MIGQRNAYTCKKCGGTIVTVDRDTGVTPFGIACRADPSCDGLMNSHFYRGPVVAGSAPPAFVWRSPTDEEYHAASEAMKVHYDQGGLDIYPATRK